MYTYELFEVEGGYGFKILQYDSPILVQEYSPDASGFEVMTLEQATNTAEVFLARFNVVEEV